MSFLIAEIVVWVLQIYGLAGLIFAVYFAFWGVQQIDPTARNATRGFRLIIIPGAMALWPLLAYRLLKGVAAPPIEKNAHRIAAVQVPWPAVEVDK